MRRLSGYASTTSGCRSSTSSSVASQRGSQFTPRYQREVWQAFEDRIVMNVLMPALSDKFQNDLDLLVRTHWPGVVDSMADAGISLHLVAGRVMRRRPSYEIKPHRDPRWTFLTCPNATTGSSTGRNCAGYSRNGNPLHVPRSGSMSAKSRWCETCLDGQTAPWCFSTRPAPTAHRFQPMPRLRPTGISIRCDSDRKPPPVTR